MIIIRRNTFHKGRVQPYIALQEVYTVYFTPLRGEIIIYYL